MGDKGGLLSTKKQYCCCRSREVSTPCTRRWSQPLGIRVPQILVTGAISLFAGGGGVGFGWFFVEFTAGHAFGSGVNFAFVEEFVVGWGGRFGTGKRRPRCDTGT